MRDSGRPDPLLGRVSRRSLVRGAPGRGPALAALVGPRSPARGPRPAPAPDRPSRAAWPSVWGRAPAPGRPELGRPGRRSAPGRPRREPCSTPLRGGFRSPCSRAGSPRPGGRAPRLARPPALPAPRVPTGGPPARSSPLAPSPARGPDLSIRRSASSRRVAPVEPRDPPWVLGRAPAPSPCERLPPARAAGPRPPPTLGAGATCSGPASRSLPPDARGLGRPTLVPDPEFRGAPPAPDGPERCFPPLTGFCAPRDFCCERASPDPFTGWLGVPGLLSSERPGAPAVRRFASPALASGPPPRPPSALPRGRGPPPPLADRRDAPESGLPRPSGARPLVATVRLRLLTSIGHPRPAPRWTPAQPKLKYP